MENENVKYMLVLEKRSFDYMPIYIGLLDIGCGDNYQSIMQIDMFTKSYSRQELIDSIKRSNTITADYIDGLLCVIELNDNKTKYTHKYNVITNDIYSDFDIVEFMYKSFNNKDIINSINVKISNLTDNNEIKDNLKSAYQDKNIRNYLKHLYLLPYVQYRELILYLINKYPNKEDVLTRKKVA